MKEAIFKILSVCKGGGYHYCRTEPVHPKANAKGLYPLHRVLMENKLGRLLGDDEHVHHRNEDKSDDDIDNLEILSPAEHTRLHVTVPEETMACANCGRPFRIKPHKARLRLSRKKYGGLTCSLSCGAAMAQRARRTSRSNDRSNPRVDSPPDEHHAPPAAITTTHLAAGTLSPARARLAARLHGRALVVVSAFVLPPHASVFAWGRLKCRHRFASEKFLENGA